VILADPSLGDRKLAADAAALHHAPTSGREQRITQLGAGFGFVHTINAAMGLS
jgi:hypothetical protein